MMAAAARGLEAWANHVLAESQDVCPVAEGAGSGALRDSGTVDVDPVTLKATVSYTSPPVREDARRRGRGNIAVWVHEDLHARHGAGKTAKFLERPAKASSEIGVTLIAVELRRLYT
jgi:hypothetical protein